MENKDETIVLVSNIPSTYHTSDLRRFFSDYVEQEKFICFHYRHRVEKRNSESPDESNKTKENPNPSTNNASIISNISTSFSQQVTARVHKVREVQQKSPTTCCFVKMNCYHVEDFVTCFHHKFWLDSEDCEMMTTCLADKVALDEQSDLKNMPELRPPNIMPRGNVGTPTQFFLDAIRDCRLPAKLIGKLKLEFPKGKHKKYGSVAFEYKGREGHTMKTLTSINRRKLEALNTKGPQVEDGKDKSEPEDDDDTCEEWERHEALHDDVEANRTIFRQVNSNSYWAAGGDLEQQAGTKEKPFEDEIEDVWEKGRSGINWYTDALFWKTQESQDFDEQTTDDWDVDMSVYYEKDTNHDKDAVDRLSMRTSEFLRAGKHEESLFSKKSSGKRPAFGGKRPSMPSSAQSHGFKPSGSKKSKNIGLFEVHNRGVAGEIMAKAGWKEGAGLGPSEQGIPQALDGSEDGQGPREKRGLGYHGERIVFASSTSSKQVGKLIQNVDLGAGPSSGHQWKPPPPPGQRISSVFTRPEDLDPPERVNRTNPQLYLKFRNQSIKFHSGGVQGGPKNNKK